MAPNKITAATKIRLLQGLGLRGCLIWLLLRNEADFDDADLWETGHLADLGAVFVFFPPGGTCD